MEEQFYTTLFHFIITCVCVIQISTSDARSPICADRSTFLVIIGEGAKRARHSQVCSIENRIYIIIGERAKRARHSQVCSIENRGYIYIYIIYSTCKFCSYNP